MLPEVARKILSSDPVAEAEKKKEAEEAKMAGGQQYHGKSKKANPKVRVWRWRSRHVLGRSWRVDAARL